MKLNLFVIESPLQALSAYEARESICAEGKSVALVRLWGGGRKENDKQIKKVINLSEWEEVIYFNTGSLTSMGMHVNIIKNIAKTSQIFKGEICNIFIGDFNSEWMHYMKCAIRADNIYLLDDGSNTIAVYNEYISKNINWPKKNRHFVKQLFHSLLYSRFYNKCCAEKKTTIFSSFYLCDESPFVIRNTYSKLRIRMCKKTFKEDEVFYFGAKYSESGVMHRHDELKFLENVISFYERQGKLFVYIPHRDEKESKLDSIKNLGNVVVKNLNMPAELYLLTNNRVPSSIGGAYTSVLPNVKVMFDCFSMTSFRIPYASLNKKHRDSIDKIYQNYSEVGIEVMNI